MCSLSPPVWLRCVAIVLSLPIYAVAVAQNPAPLPAQLTLRQALDFMRARDPNLALAQTAVDQALADKISAGERPNATLAYSTGKINPAGHNGPGTIWDKSYDTIVDVSQPFERGRKRTHRLAQADANADAAHADFIDSTRSEQLAVTNAYWELKRAEEKYTNAQALAAIEQRSLQAAERRLKLGDLPRLDLERMRIEAASADNAVDVARGTLRDAQVSLTALLDATAQSANVSAADAWPRAVAVDLRPDAKPAAQDEAFEADAELTKRPDMLAATRRVAAAEAALDLAHAQTSRDVTLSSQYEHNPTPFGHTLLGVGVSIPLFTGNHYEGEIRRAYADLDAARANLARVRVAALADMQRARADLAATARRAERYDQDLVERARSTEAAVEQAYARGGLGLADLLEERRALKSVQDDATDAHADYAEALAALTAAIPDSIQTPSP